MKTLKFRFNTIEELEINELELKSNYKEVHQMSLDRETYFYVTYFVK